MQVLIYTVYCPDVTSSGLQLTPFIIVNLLIVCLIYRCIIKRCSFRNVKTSVFVTLLENRFFQMTVSLSDDSLLQFDIYETDRQVVGMYQVKRGYLIMQLPPSP